MDRKQVAVDVAVVMGLLVWTAAAAVAVWWGMWTLNVDASCDGSAQHDLGGGGWTVFVALLVWASGVIGVALWRRRASWWVTAALSVIGAGVLAAQIATAGATSLCW